jgi:hypothetical protein
MTDSVAVHLGGGAFLDDIRQDRFRRNAEIY